MAEADRLAEFEILKAENVRLEKERLEAENARLVELEKLKAENQRLEKEKVAADAARQVELERLKAENKRLEQERVAAEIDRLNAENERLQREGLAAEAAKQAELEKIEQERMEREEQAKAEANRIEKERLAHDAEARQRAIKQAEERAMAAALADEQQGAAAAPPPVQKGHHHGKSRQYSKKSSSSSRKTSSSKAAPADQSEAIYFCERARDVYMLKGDTLGVKKMEAAIKAIQMQQQMQPSNVIKPAASKPTPKTLPPVEISFNTSQTSLGSLRSGGTAGTGYSYNKKPSREFSKSLNAMYGDESGKPPHPPADEDATPLSTRKERLGNLFKTPDADDAPGGGFADMLKKSRKNVLKTTSTLDAQYETSDQGKGAEEKAKSPEKIEEAPPAQDDGPKRSYAVNKMSVSEKRKMLFG